MNSAFTHHHAETKAGRLARRVVLACALVLGAGSAFAQQHGDRGDRRDDQGMQQQAPRFRLPQDQRDQRDEARAYEEQRRMQQQQMQQEREQRRGGNGSSGRMTPDERRDLRRQINEAGMDLYPQRR